LFYKTFEGYSLAETLISIFLLSFLIITYSNLSALHHTQANRDILVNRLFADAHSVAVIIEDKSIGQIPLDLFTTVNPVPATFFARYNHTIEMNLPIFASLFDIQIPTEIQKNNYTVICSFSTHLLEGIEIKQIYVYLLTRYNKGLVYGFASFVV
jgi:hypothetical protein